MNYKIPIVIGAVLLLTGGIYLIQLDGPKQPEDLVNASDDIGNVEQSPVAETQSPLNHSATTSPLEETVESGEAQRMASTIEEAAEFCGERFFSDIHRDNVTCPITEELAAVLNEWDVLPFAPPAKQQCEEVKLGNFSGGLVCEWGPPLDPYDGYSNEDLADLALNQGDALAAAKLAYRPMPATEAYIWLMTAAALSDSNRAAGALLRAAQGFSYQVSVVEGKAIPNYGGLVRRISLEEVASGKGHPAATPDYWLGQLKEVLGETDINPYLKQIEDYKSRIETALQLVRSGAPQSEVAEVLDV